MTQLKERTHPSTVNALEKTTPLEEQSRGLIPSHLFILCGILLKFKNEKGGGHRCIKRGSCT